jgi:hypothetical protein
METKEPDFTNSIFSYIDQHYKQWVDFAVWHCKRPVQPQICKRLNQKY